jgi:AcrR family transcriptional regulator
MKNGRVNISKIRRDEIVDAAIAVINDKGMQGLSLSAIESRAGMSRGQLTYYFRTKEAILLAVFDRLIEMMHRRVAVPGQNGDGGFPCENASVSERVQFLLNKLLFEGPEPTFITLQYTFLAQMGHRPDFRERLARLYAEWRGHMGGSLAEELAEADNPPPAAPRTVASLVQAILHGVVMQLAADPDAFDREEMLALCLDLLTRYVRVRLPASAAGKKKPRRPNRTARSSRPRGTS